jgi:hypothetical protein
MPSELIAATSKKYVVPFVRPIAVHVSDVDDVGHPAALA